MFYIRGRRSFALASVLAALVFCGGSMAFAGYQSQLIQRVNVSKLAFGPCTFANAAASNDSKGEVGGTISVRCSGLSAPAAPAPVTQFDFSHDERTNKGSAWIAYSTRKNADGSPKDTISVEGTYSADASTERLVNPKIVGMKINNNAVVPTTN